MKRRLYEVWHQDSPGTRVLVRRWFKPRVTFSRTGEKHVPYAGNPFYVRMKRQGP